jgi:ubiquitin conjugation factor E4 B
MYALNLADHRLKLEDCIPDTKLKAKIDAWVAEGKAGRAEDVMDVDEL